MNCCDDPLVAGRGFTRTSTTGWSSTRRPSPFVGGSAEQVSPHRGVQRSDAEANRLVDWLLDNGVEVGRTGADIAVRDDVPRRVVRCR